MIVPRTSRDEIVRKLRNKVQRRQPILISSASNGLTAKLLERAGADCNQG